MFKVGANGIAKSHKIKSNHKEYWDRKKCMKTGLNYICEGDELISGRTIELYVKKLIV